MTLMPTTKEAKARCANTAKKVTDARAHARFIRILCSFASGIQAGGGSQEERRSTDDGVQPKTLKG